MSSFALRQAYNKLVDEFKPMGFNKDQKQEIERAFEIEQEPELIKVWANIKTPSVVMVEVREAFQFLKATGVWRNITDEDMAIFGDPILSTQMAKDYSFEVLQNNSGRVDAMKTLLHERGIRIMLGEEKLEEKPEKEVKAGGTTGIKALDDIIDKVKAQGGKVFGVAPNSPASITVDSNGKMNPSGMVEM